MVGTTEGKFNHSFVSHIFSFQTYLSIFILRPQNSRKFSLPMQYDHETQKQKKYFGIIIIKNTPIKIIV